MNVLGNYMPSVMSSRRASADNLHSKIAKLEMLEKTINSMMK